MSKAVRVSTSISAAKTTAKTAARDSDQQQLVSIALFCGLGLLISLVAVLLGVQGVWY